MGVGPVNPFGLQFFYFFGVFFCEVIGFEWISSQIDQFPLAVSVGFDQFPVAVYNGTRTLMFEV